MSDQKLQLCFKKMVRKTIRQSICRMLIFTKKRKKQELKLNIYTFSLEQRYKQRTEKNTSKLQPKLCYSNEFGNGESLLCQIIFNLFI